jgi:hypothetical protein
MLGSYLSFANPPSPNRDPASGHREVAAFHFRTEPVPLCPAPRIPLPAFFAAVSEPVYEMASKVIVRKGMWVRIPPAALVTPKT